MNTSIVVSPARAFQALTSDDLRRTAPSIYAEHAHPGVSSRYAFVSTAQVVDLLAAEEWEPVKASEQRVQLESPIEGLKLNKALWSLAGEFANRQPDPEQRQALPFPVSSPPAYPIRPCRCKSPCF